MTGTDSRGAMMLHAILSHRLGRKAALGFGVASLLSTGLMATATPAAAQSPAPTAGGCATNARGAAHVGRFSGIAHPSSVNCPAPPGGDAANGTPPLLFHGGPVMGTRSTGPVVLTPIFWSPSGHQLPSGYTNILNTYLGDVAAASGTRTNVYSTATEYSGSNGAIRYQIARGGAVNDKNPLPRGGCQLNGHDKTGIYGDGSGYDACLSDDQIIGETDRVITDRGLPRDLSHIYVMYLPKHVESCFFPGGTSTANNFCTINHEPSAAYCAYHSQAPSGAVYANMPFPVYASSVGFTCGSDAVYRATIETPNGDPDADTEVSPSSHEVMEAITDPDTVTGWFDSSGFENGDECAYVFGATHGPGGQLYNQTINNRHYLTQEEFSNADFARSGGGCLQHA
jgi:hypothetical protein